MIRLSFFEIRVYYSKKEKRMVGDVWCLPKRLVVGEGGGWAGVGWPVRGGNWAGEGVVVVHGEGSRNCSYLCFFCFFSFYSIILLVLYIYILRGVVGGCRWPPESVVAGRAEKNRVPEVRTGFTNRFGYPVFLHI
ncbi:hypothetical protein RND81_11G087400 [Saponaria officinalis]|uniref:Transmembrane protein n=1 Tax=Saponaria officinalis TaxID=3572 RepID=A0AAW1HJH6_SAPOF